MEADLSSNLRRLRHLICPWLTLLAMISPIAHQALASEEDAGQTQVEASRTPASAEPVRRSGEHPSSKVATLQNITNAATAYGLPPSFLSRLIWQESRFDPGAVSRAGAQGIAQF